MCGKFTQRASWQDLVAFSQPLTVAADEEPLVSATPMQFANILRLDAQGRREVVPMRWGFSARGAATPARPKHIHVRAETIDERPTFASAFASDRGLLLVHSFNVGEDLPNGKTRQWVITPPDGRPLAIAVICETWTRADEKGEETLLTFAMVTTPANALVSKVTDRMPAILPPEAWAAWLGEAGAPLHEVKALLRTYEDEGAWEMAPQDRKRPPEQGDLFV